ncbi:MAG: hypothetical protein ACRD3W_01870 [Terriglobales bacterium]
MNEHDRSAALAERLGKPEEPRSVTLLRGETFWQLAQVKYYGRHPIAALFEANGLTVEVRSQAGRTTFCDPIYYAGQAYLFPAENELDALEQSFWQKLKEHGLGGTIKERVGASDEKTAVCLRWDESLWSLAQSKYDDDFEIEGVFEANELAASVTNKDGLNTLAEPICFAGHSYILPPRTELHALSTRYQERIKADLLGEENI